MTSSDSETGLLVQGLATRHQGQRFEYQLGVGRGECLGVVGPSGGGKSTLLALIAGFAPAVGGDVLVRGESIMRLPAARRPVTLVFQEHNLFAHLSVAQNVGLGLDPRLKLDRAQRLRVQEALARVGLDGLAARLPGTLSGGQRSRAALARALLRARPVLLLDEPLAALGPAQRREMLGLIETLMEDYELSVLLVSHQPDEIAPLCRRIAFIAAGKVAWHGASGALSAEGAPGVVRRYLG